MNLLPNRNNYSSLAATQRLFIRPVSHVPGATFPALLLGLFINGLRIDLGTGAPWETRDNINGNTTGLRAKRERKRNPPLRRIKKAIVGQTHVGRRLKFHFVWQRRRIPQEEARNQPEQGASFSQIALGSPVLETFIIKRPFMTAAGGAT